MIAILGGTGMLGMQFVSKLTNSSHEFKIFDRSNFNIAKNENELASSLSRAEIVINCIAYTDVPGAESNRRLAMEVNSEFPARLAKVTSKTGARLIHFSTDYVFDGLSSEPFGSQEPTQPLNVYGLSKASGEKGIIDHGDKFRIIRTSWLYGQYGSCFPKKIQHMLLSGASPRIVADQIGRPTWAADVVDFTLMELATIQEGKILHAASAGTGSWFDFAKEIAASIDPELVERILPIRSDEFTDVVIRPKFSVLSLGENVNYQIGDWKNRWRLAASEVLD